MDYSDWAPRDVRALISAGKLQGQTSGMCAGYAQANLCILPKAQAFDFLLFCMRNPRPCPILEVGEAGCMARGDDVCTAFPKYRIWRAGELVEEVTDISAYWQDDLVYFLIGCSFSFESELLQAGVPVRHIEEGRNVPMFNTNLALEPAGVFHGNMVVSMRPIPHDLVVRSDPAAIGIADVQCPDYGDSVTIRPGEVPVFWPCGVTPQAAVMAAKVPFAITHAPGHMLITDVPNTMLKY